MQEEKFEQAADDLSEAISISPMVALYYLRRAQCYMSLGKFNAAVADFSKVIDLSPDSISLKTRVLPALNGRAAAYRALGEMGLAMQDSTRAQEIENSD
jgi:tetratricopeptide (TPR) repeat protein